MTISQRFWTDHIDDEYEERTNRNRSSRKIIAHRRRFKESKWNEYSLGQLKLIEWLTVLYTHLSSNVRTAIWRDESISNMNIYLVKESIWCLCWKDWLFSLSFNPTGKFMSIVKRMVSWPLSRYVNYSGQQVSLERVKLLSFSVKFNIVTDGWP